MLSNPLQHHGETSHHAGNNQAKAKALTDLDYASSALTTAAARIASASTEG